MSKLTNYLSEREMYSLHNYSINTMNRCDALSEDDSRKILSILMEFQLYTEDDIKYMLDHIDSIDGILTGLREGFGWFNIMNRINREGKI